MNNKANVTETSFIGLGIKKSKSVNFLTPNSIRFKIVNPTAIL